MNKRIKDLCQERIDNLNDEHKAIDEKHKDIDQSIEQYNILKDNKKILYSFDCHEYMLTKKLNIKNSHHVDFNTLCEIIHSFYENILKQSKKYNICLYSPQTYYNVLTGEKNINDYNIKKHEKLLKESMDNVYRY